MSLNASKANKALNLLKNNSANPGAATKDNLDNISRNQESHAKFSEHIVTNLLKDIDVDDGTEVQNLSSAKRDEASDLQSSHNESFDYQSNAADMTMIHEMQPSISKQKVIDLSQEWNDKATALENEYKR